jgi:flagellar motor switch protein FliN/FliY
MEENEIENKSTNYDKLIDVSVTLVTELGSTNISMRDFLQLKTGTVLDLKKPAGESVELYVNKKIVGRGEVMVYEENLAIRINEILDSDALIQYFKKERQ